MPERPGEWNLLNRHRDPVVADVDQIEQLTVYYTNMAKDIEDQATVLRRIGEGDESQFKGQSADRVREKSKQVSEQLTQMSGRYSAVRDALKAYLPHLQTALTESEAALADARVANDSLSSATGMSDPRVGRPSDAPPLTPEEETAGRQKDAAVSEAESGGTRAIARLEGALAELDARGRQASETIRDAWNDGLKDSWKDRLKAAFQAFLKILVKVLTWIGVALAVLAFIIPGLGMAALAGAIVTGLAFAATAAQAAMGDASFIDVIIAGVGVLLLGAGAALTKVVSVAKSGVATKHAAKFTEIRTTSAAATRTLQARQKELTAKIRAGVAESKIRPQQRPDVRAAARAERDGMRVERADVDGRIAAERARLLTASKTYHEQATTIGKIDPNWWNLKKIPTTIRKDVTAVTQQFVKGSEGYRGYRLDKLFGTDGVNGFEKYRAAATEAGVVAKELPRAFTFFNGGRSVYGWAGMGFALGANPTGLGTDLSRWETWENVKYDFPGGNARPEAPL